MHSKGLQGEKNFEIKKMQEFCFVGSKDQKGKDG